jgi:hypothetical protein
MFAVACLAATGLAACGLSLNGLQTGDDAGPSLLDATGDVTMADASQEGSGGDTGAGPETASGGDTGSTGDVVVPETGLVDGCVPTGPENCTNGIDDDCNGLTDCADPACTTQGYACVTPSPKTGWDFVAFDATSQAGCPATLMAKNVDVDPTNLGAPAVCGCTCAVGAPPSCEQGTFAAKGGNDSTCSLGGTNFPASGGACNNTTLPMTPFVQVTPPAAMGGMCTANGTTTKPPTGATQGEVCSGEKAFGSGCTAPQVCGLVPAGFTACVHHGGANMGCPGAPYTMPHSVGTLQDSRSCGNCACGAPTATCSGFWNFYSNGGCGGAVTVQVTANGACDPTNAQPAAMFQSNELDVQPSNVACATPAAPPSMGGVTLNGADTICCE